MSQEIWSLGNCVAVTQFPRKNRRSYLVPLRLASSPGLGDEGLGTRLLFAGPHDVIHLSLAGRTHLPDEDVGGKTSVHQFKNFQYENLTPQAELEESLTSSLTSRPLTNIDLVDYTATFLWLALLIIRVQQWLHAL